MSMMIGYMAKEEELKQKMKHIEDDYQVLKTKAAKREA
jgi:hypothetical protein